jgi:hypothetical protein
MLLASAFASGQIPLKDDTPCLSGGLTSSGKLNILRKKKKKKTQKKKKTKKKKKN